MQQQMDTRDQADVAASLASAQAQMKLRDAAYQRAIGNEKDAIQLFKEAGQLMESRLGHVANLAHAGAQLAGTTYTAQMHRLSSQETNAVHLQIAKMQEASKLGLMDLRQQAQMSAALKAVEGDPLLKKLAEMAPLDAGAAERYKAREAEIYVQHFPELAAGVTPRKSEIGRAHV